MALTVIVAVALTLGIVRLWPRPPLADSIAGSTAVFDTGHRLLRLGLAADQQYRLWTPLEEVAPVFIEALLLHEDQHFHRHPGVDPTALLRAAWRTLKGPGRQGGSTLSMQLARLYHGLDTASVAGKLRQVLAALWLEARYSKRELLEAHVNLLPYGGNVQGVGTASRIYFDKPPGDLSLPEALSLVLIPQAPAARAPGAVEPSGLRTARMRLFERWVRLHPEAARDRGLVALPLTYGQRSDLPFAAPHLSSRLLAQAGSGSVHSTLDLRLQGALEGQIRRYLEQARGQGLRNASALLVDWRDASVRALVGSAAFFDADLHGQVDGTRARRSPGSTLKPFVYGMALDQGLIHPRTMLKDAPTAFGPFAPENFDGDFVGPIDATQALVRSRNVPAVALAAQLQDGGIHDLLRRAGVRDLLPAEHYGLALPLGGGELSMQELVRLYAMLPRRGRLPLRLRDRRDQPPVEDGPALLSPEAAFLVLEMLRANPRPDDLMVQGVGRARGVAWKTGTSWGFRDAWTVGVFGPWVLAVWVGEFDGRSNPAFVGLHAAAPLFFRMVDALRGLPGYVELAPVQPAGLARVQVCAATGDLPNAACPRRVSTGFIPGVSPIRLSQVHRRVAVDRASGRLACPPHDPARIRWELHEYWPSDLMRLFARAGVPRRAPPAGDCRPGEAAPGLAPQIASPLQGVSYPLRDAEFGRRSLPLLAHAEAGVRQVYWFVDQAFVGATAPGVALGWIPSRPGRFEVRALDESGRSAARDLRVEWVP